MFPFSMRPLRRRALLGTVLLLASMWAADGRMAIAQPGNPTWHIKTATPQQLPTESLTIESGQKTHDLQVALADEPGERRIGLMFRAELPPGEGMLFDFGEVRQVSMWMKNTYISLDMIFVKNDGTIESIVRETETRSLESIPSIGPVRAVLELKAGAADRLGLKPGDQLVHPMFDGAGDR